MIKLTKDEIQLLSHINEAADLRAAFDEYRLDYLYSQFFAADRSTLSDILLKIGVNPLQYTTSVIMAMFDHSQVVDATVIIPEHIKLIEEYAFENTSLKALQIDGSDVEIQKWAFHQCIWLEDIDIKGYISQVGPMAFSECGALKRVVFPEGLDFLDDYAFMGCVNLEYVELPHSITSIGRTCFDNCYVLETIEYNGSKDEFKKVKHAMDLYDLGSNPKIIFTK